MALAKKKHHAIFYAWPVYVYVCLSHSFEFGQWKRRPNQRYGLWNDLNLNTFLMFYLMEKCQPKIM